MKDSVWLGTPATVAFLTLFSGAAVVMAAPLYIQTNLTSDVPGLAANLDPNLQNPWGFSFTATSPFWISDQGANVSTLYNGAGVPNALVVAVPHPALGPQGPTGQVANGTTDFALTTGNPARFIFANLSGTISGWNPAVSATSAVIMYSATDSAVYTGLANGASSSGNVLYAADFGNGKVDIINSSFQKIGSFSDPNAPSGYSPYNVQNINGRLFVTYAKVDPMTGRASEDLNQGLVDEFDLNGNFVRRLATDTHLSSPWGVTIAPSSFGEFGGALLVGNFGDGGINAFNPTTGVWLGTVLDSMGNPIENDGLWAIGFRAPGSGFDPSLLYFAAGINDEANGLFGTIQPVPEPATLCLFGIAAGVFGIRRSRTSRRRTS